MFFAPDIYSSRAFEDKFTYTGNDLGAIWCSTSTTFKVWSPFASAVTLVLYSDGDISSSAELLKIPMILGKKGVWEITVSGDLNGTYYTYLTDINGMITEACDPYAKAAGVNGDRSMVIDLSSTNPDGWENDKNPNINSGITDAVIYELHVRDFSADESSGMINKGKYLAFTETGTTNLSGMATGIDYLKDLGVTHIQLTPVYDYATVDESLPSKPQYNWGYDPLNYNVPEGSYSTNPYDGAVRIKEFKQMVKSLHDNGFSVIMDVVYNHTYSTDFCFNRIVPEYFYRFNSNGSGCGNDTASERSMVSKYIVDSVVYWAKEYHIDGFRFDLMGLIDINTMNTLCKQLKKINPSIIVYGEGWDLPSNTAKAGTVLAKQTSAAQMPDIAQFNDYIRDSLRGSVFDSSDKGYINGNLKLTGAVKNALTGKTLWTSVPSQLINYVSCHDNLTLWDKINSSNTNNSEDECIRQNLLAASIVYLSQGTPFMFAGEELLRSKTNPDGTFNDNSYNSGDEINSIKWYTLNDSTYMMVHDYYKGLIAFRKAHKSLRMKDCFDDNITFLEELPDGVIAYTISAAEGEEAEKIMVIINPSLNSVTVSLDDGTWNVFIEGTSAGTKILRTAEDKITVDGISVTVLTK